ncbi:MAG: hypothetical protein Ct9H300mP21_05920 [Pseudomonadota bacterium]|nr:MAG: hypothetical protein Ct9H300mP21_05920 [Pseudomonadota bacterium]
MRKNILQEIGVEFRGDAEALQIWGKKPGADIDGERVRKFPQKIVKKKDSGQCTNRIYATRQKSGKKRPHRWKKKWFWFRLTVHRLYGI